MSALINLGLLLKSVHYVHSIPTISSSEIHVLGPISCDSTAEFPPSAIHNKPQEE